MNPIRKLRARLDATALLTAPVDLNGFEWEDVLRASARSLCYSKETGELTKGLLRLYDEFKLEHPDIEGPEDIPGSVRWLWYVHEGHGILPRRVPAAVLAAYVNGMRKGTDPQPLHRCEGCHMILPDRGPDGEGESWPGPCPCCGGKKIAKARWAGERLEWVT